MRRKPVRSSMLRSVRYDVETLIFEVEFHHGRVYQSYGIEEETYLELVGATSIGDYFNESIRDQFYNVRVKEQLS